MSFVKYFLNLLIYTSEVLIMRRTILFLCLIGIVLPGTSQIIFEDIEKEWIKKNNIKKKEQYDYAYSGGEPGTKNYKSSVVIYNEDGNILEERNYRATGAIMYVSTYKYDSHGNRIKYLKYKGDKEKITYKQSFIYDNKGNKLMESGFNGAENYKNTYKYNGAGELVEINYYLGSTLDEKRLLERNGNITVIKVYDANDKFKYTITNRYDGNGNLLEEVKTEENVESRKVNYAYDHNQNINEEVKFLYGNFSYQIKYKYDSKGRLIELEERVPDIPSAYVLKKYRYSPDGKLVAEEWRNDPNKDFSSKEYKYNSNGVLIETDCYFASYKFKVLYKYKYEKF